MSCSTGRYIKGLALALVCAAVIAQPSHAQTRLDYSLKTLEGEDLRLRDFYQRGPTLITFWALWCVPCKQELHALQIIYTKYREKGVTILAVNQDSPRSVAKVRSYVSSQQYTMPVVLDPNGQLFQAANGQTLPFALLLDTTGTVVHTSIGYLPGDELRLELEIDRLIPAGR
jgi:cytochrome c biogenesis protein CcmG, thiol:disulfide interchange protein DsbE